MGAGGMAAAVFEPAAGNQPSRRRSLMLALYWLALLIGRVAAQWILPRARHGRMLLASVLAAMLGCVFLLATDNHLAR